MKIIVIDPGEANGLVAWEVGESPMFLMESNSSDMYDFLIENKADIVVVEDSAQLGDAEQLIRVGLLLQWLRRNSECEVVRITPGEWKPIAKARNWKVNSISKHTKDAYNILRYYLLSQEKIDIGDKE